MDRGTRTAALGALLLAALAGGVLFLSRGGHSPGPAGPAAGAAGRSATTAPGTAAGVALAGPPAVVTVPRGNGASRSHPASGTAAPSASGSAATPSGVAAAASTAPAAGGPPASSGPVSAQDGTAAQQVLSLINQSRAAAGLPALTVTSGLTASSAAHNLKMAGGCGLSHQCPGEAALGARETAAGVIWSSAGENIGEGGPVADTSAAIAQLAVSLTQSMLNEKPPDDGHRMNILGSSFTHAGIAVYRDSSGTVWLTQDFSN